MAVERIGIEAALASLRQTYPYACPNEGLACTRTIPSATERAAPIQHLVKQGVLVTLSNNKPSQRQCPCAGFLQQLQLWHEMRYVFKPDHPGYTTVMMRQLAMRYDAGEELSSITHDLAVPSEAAAQVLLALRTKNNQKFVFWP